MEKKIRKNRRKKCLVCDGKILSPTKEDRLVHHCLSHGDDPGLPSSCWLKQNMPFAADLLATIPPKRQHTPHSMQANRRRIDLAKDVSDEIAKSGLANINLEALCRKYDLKHLKLFYERIPDTSPLKSPVKAELDRLDTFLHEKWPQLKTASLPPELARGVQLYAEASERRMKLKIERGHHYSIDTVRRRINAAIKFSKYLADQGIQFWPEVSQGHIDNYLEETNRTASQHAFTLLSFLRRHFRLMPKFIRPRSKKVPPSEAVYDPDKIREIIARVIRHDDHETIVATLFLLIYAQNAARCSEMTFNNFCRENGKLKVRFFEQWIELDTLTEKFLYKFRPILADPNFTPTDDPFFTLKKDPLLYRVRLLLKLPMKKLRLAAIANIIRSGVIDRTSIVQILGVSLPTIAYLEGLFHWDLQSTVPKEIVDMRNEVIRGERRE